MIGLLADLLVLLHAAFVLFVIFGGFLVMKWPWLGWLHIPAAIWGTLIEWFGWICPLTPLENRLRESGGGVGYESGFIEHYVIPVLYPMDLTREGQILLGAVVLIINLTIYMGIFLRNRKS